MIGLNQEEREALLAFMQEMVRNRVRVWEFIEWPARRPPVVIGGVG